jgi:hypothetical protein
MLLFLLAVAILASSFVAKRLSLPAAVRRRLLLIGAGTSGAVLLLASMRLVPLGVIALLIGVGFAASTILRARSAASGFEDMGSQRGQAPPRRAQRGMSREEALAVLGLSEGAAEADIHAAHRRMIVRAHPDQGGSDYLAAKVNEAKTVLLPKGS